jgi:hypothetical protein
MKRLYGELMCQVLAFVRESDPAATEKSLNATFGYKRWTRQIARLTVLGIVSRTSTGNFIADPMRSYDRAPGDRSRPNKGTGKRGRPRKTPEEKARYKLGRRLRDATALLVAHGYVVQREARHD